MFVCLFVCLSQTPTHWTCWRPAAIARWFVALDGCVRSEFAQRLRFRREAKKNSTIFHTHACTYACTRGFLIQCSLFARSRGPTHKSSRVGGLLAAIKIWEFRSPPPPRCCYYADSWRDLSVTNFYRKKQMQKRRFLFCAWVPNRTFLATLAFPGRYLLATPHELFLTTVAFFCCYLFPAMATAEYCQFA